MQESVQDPEVRPVEMSSLWTALHPSLPTWVPQGMEVTEDHDPSRSVSCPEDRSSTCIEQQPRLTHCWCCFIIYHRIRMCHVSGI